MSVFAEFHKAWRARFPGKDLPSAWEEDVRANLAKHRARAAILREDLEKEQFYVEYLERLLEDVQEHSRGGERGQGEGAPTPYTCMQDHVDEAINSVLAEQCTQSCATSPIAEEETDDDQEKLSATGNVKHLTRRFDKNINYRARPPAFLRSTSVPATSVNPVPKVANHRHSGCGDPFITVIPISGEGGEGGATTNQSTCKTKKKSPPVVPPKTFRKPRPPSIGEGSSEPRPPAPLPHQCLPSCTNQSAGLLHKSASSSSSSGSERQILISKSSSSASSLDILTRRPATPPAIYNSDEGNSEDEEPLYDTVAPDEEDDSPFDTLKSGDSEGSMASKSGYSGGGLSSPCSSPAPLEYPPIHSPKHRNYVNLDFFLKR